MEMGRARENGHSPEQKFFRAELFGFNRVEVLTYIERISIANAEKARALNATIVALQRELSTAQQDSTSLQVRTQEVCNELAEEKRRAESAVARAEELSRDVRNAQDDAAAYKSRLFAQEQENKALQKDNQCLSEKIDSLTQELTAQAARQAAAGEELADIETRTRLSLDRARAQAADLLREAQQQAGETRQQADADAQRIRTEAKSEAARAQVRLLNSANNIANTIAALKAHLSTANQEIRIASGDLQRATDGVAAALEGAERELVRLGAQVKAFPEPEKPQPRPEPSAEAPAAAQAITVAAPLREQAQETLRPRMVQPVEREPFDEKSYCEALKRVCREEAEKARYYEDLARDDWRAVRSSAQYADRTREPEDAFYTERLQREERYRDALRRREEEQYQEELRRREEARYQDSLRRREEDVLYQEALRRREEKVRRQEDERRREELRAREEAQRREQLRMQEEAERLREARLQEEQRRQEEERLQAAEQQRQEEAARYQEALRRVEEKERALEEERERLNRQVQMQMQQEAYTAAQAQTPTAAQASAPVMQQPAAKQFERPVGKLHAPTARPFDPFDGSMPHTPPYPTADHATGWDVPPAPPAEQAQPQTPVYVPGPTPVAPIASFSQPYRPPSAASAAPVQPTTVEPWGAAAQNGQSGAAQQYAGNGSNAYGAASLPDAVAPTAPEKTPAVSAVAFGTEASYPSAGVPRSAFGFDAPVIIPYNAPIPHSAPAAAPQGDAANSTAPTVSQSSAFSGARSTAGGYSALSEALLDGLNSLLNEK
jgi:hypothetical protein